MKKVIFLVYIVTNNGKSVNSKVYRQFEDIDEAYEAFTELDAKGYGTMIRRKELEVNTNICVVCGKEIISARKKKTCSGTCRNRLCKMKKEGLI